MTATWVDGNELAGALQEILSLDVTLASGTCAGCGSVRVMAEARVFERAPGLVARCLGCDGVLLRVVRAPGRVYLDLTGISCLEISVPDSSAT